MSYKVIILVIEKERYIDTEISVNSINISEFSQEIIKKLNLYAIELRIWDKDDESITIRGTYMDIDFSTQRIASYIYNPFIRFVDVIQNRSKNSMTPMFNYINKYGISKFNGRLTKIFAGETVTNIDLSGWDTSKIIIMENLFDGCKELKSINVSTWDTSHVMSMKFLFRNCYSLENVDVGSWDVSNLKCAAGMFENCSSIECLDVSRWNTEKLTNARSMFKNCEFLKILDVSQWNTSKLRDASSMFEYCERLQKIDISNWLVNNLTYAYRMFHYCLSVEELDVSQWFTEELIDISLMFYDCKKVENIDIHGWITYNLTNAENAISSHVNEQTKNDFNKLYDNLHETVIIEKPVFQEIDIAKPQSLNYFE